MTKPVSFSGKVSRKKTLPQDLTDTGIVTVALAVSFLVARMHKTSYFVVLLLIAIATPLFADDIPAEFDSLPQEVQQAVVVEAGEGVTARVSGWERKEGSWRQVLAPVEAVVGRNGLAPLGEKREGDGRTPSGIFALRRAFGYEADVQTGLDYRRVSEKDFWVDAPASPLYNQWVSGDTPEASHEVLRRPDNLYKYAVVIEYNTDPALPGMGSAIFMHVWRAANEPTTGCVAMAEDDLVNFLRWLDIRYEPVIVILPAGEAGQAGGRQENKGINRDGQK